MIFSNVASSLLPLASCASAHDSNFEVTRVLQQEAADPVAPFDLSVGLVGSGSDPFDSQVDNDSSSSSGGVGGAVIVAVVVILLLLLCCCGCICVGGGIFYYKKKKKNSRNQKEDIIAHKNASLGVPYGGPSAPRVAQQPQPRYSDNHTHASSTSDVMSFD